MSGSEAVPSGRLEGKVVFITGAASGMGRAATLLFLEEGARVGAFDMDEAGLAALGEQTGSARERMLALVGDVTHESDVREATERTARGFGRIDIIYPNAGVLWRDRDLSVEKTDLGDWRRVLDINLTGVFLTLKHGVPYLREAGGGSIVLVGSICALAGTTPPQDAYNSTKGALVSLNRSLAVQFGPFNIRSNIIHPGMIVTPMQSTKLDDVTWVDAVEGSIPLRRMGQAEEIAKVALFLASDDSSYVTGAEIAADGGFSAA